MCKLASKCIPSNDRVKCYLVSYFYLLCYIFRRSSWKWIFLLVVQNWSTYRKFFSSDYSHNTARNRNHIAMLQKSTAFTIRTLDIVYLSTALLLILEKHLTLFVGLACGENYKTIILRGNSNSYSKPISKYEIMYWL